MIFHVVEYENSKKGNIVSNIQGLQLISYLRSSY